MFIVNARFLTQQITGVQRYAIEISLELKKIYGANILFVSPENIIHKKIADELGVQTIGNLKGHLWEQIDLLFFLLNNNTQYLLNLTGLSPIFYNKTIMMIPDMSFLRNPEWFSLKYRLVYSLFYPFNIKKAKKIITISNFSKKEILNFFPNIKYDIIVTHCSIGHEFHPSFNMVRLYDFRYILAVSSIDPRKNFLRLVQAFKLLNDKDIKLVIVGSENKLFSNDALKSEIENNSNIIFTGYINDEKLINLYSHAECFAYPSLYEGFGIPPLEAMSCGCPVVVSDASSLPEVCGNAAYYVDPNDIHNIAIGIERLLEDKKLSTELILKGFEQIKKFSWSKSAKTINLTLENLS